MEGNKLRRFVFLTVSTLSLILGPFLLGYYLGTNVADTPNAFGPGNFLHHDADITTPVPVPTSAPESTSSLAPAPLENGVKHLHLIIPATSATLDFCKLLLTGGILRYPEPTVVGWNHTGIFDGSQSHLFKITETLTYLRSLPPSADENLVLILDGFDLWFQLRPSVLLERYHRVLAQNDERLRREGLLGRVMSNFQGVNATIQSKIVFGADKWPAPMYAGEPYWWGVPESPYAADYFGPHTDDGFENSRPRWLNSGTIMGPVKEMREFFAATVNEVLKTANTEQGLEVSDQYYFARVWGRQEVERSILRDGREKFMETVPSNARMPAIADGARTDFGICMDYWQEAFQLGGGWGSAIGMMNSKGLAENASDWALSPEILDSEPPFSAVTDDQIPDLDRGWEDLTLGTNLLSKKVFPILHMTSAKLLREQWWPEMWFHPHAETLHKASRREQVRSADPDAFMTADGVKWKQYRRIVASQPKAGIWQSSGQYVPWSDVCEAHEDELYLRSKK